jgi:hypothetical protein
MKNIEIDTSFITMRRPRYRFRPKAAGGMSNSSTPPNDTFRGGPFLTQRDHEEYSPDGTDHEAFSASTSNDTNKGSPSSTQARSTPCPDNVWARREKAAPESDTDEDDDADVTFGLHEMTMATSGTDMDTDL